MSLVCCKADECRLWKRIDDLLADNVMLRIRLESYERQRHALAAVLGTTGLMPIEKAAKPSRLRKLND